jgi:mannose-6-phosphate isomerase-like protein (cupin superfamily)
MVHCRLQPGQVTKAVRHRIVEEMWHCVGGSGRLWRSFNGISETIALHSGVSCSIPTGACFQFRCDGESPLDLVIATIPPWPGEDEAEPCNGPWDASL